MNYFYWKWGFWVRNKKGKGICIAKNNPQRFSERYGYRKVYRFGPFSFEFLKAKNE